MRTDLSAYQINLREGVRHATSARPSWRDFELVPHKEDFSKENILFAICFVITILFLLSI